MELLFFFFLEFNSQLGAPGVQGVELFAYSFFLCHALGEMSSNDPKLSDGGGATRHLPHGWNVGHKLPRGVERGVAGAVTRRSRSLQRMVRRVWTSRFCNLSNGHSAI